MPVESINGVSEVRVTENKADFKNVKPEQNYQQQTKKGSSRDIWMTLSILATAAATIALIENKNIKTENKAALKKAEEAQKAITAELEKVKQEADKKIQELSDKLKQETDNKINDVVKKINKNINIKYNDLLSRTNSRLYYEADNIRLFVKQEIDKIINEAAEGANKESEININEFTEKVKADIEKKFQAFEKNAGRLDEIISEFDKIINQAILDVNQISNSNEGKNRIIFVHLKTPEFIKTFYNKISQFFKDLKIKFKRDSVEIEETINRDEPREIIIPDNTGIQDLIQRIENTTPKTDSKAADNTQELKKKYAFFKRISQFFKSIKDKFKTEKTAAKDSADGNIVNEEAPSPNDIEYEQIIPEDNNTIRFVLKNNQPKNNK